MEELKILLFDEDKLTQTIIESYLKELTFECSLEKYSSFSESIINEFDGLKVIIVNINGSNKNLTEKISSLSSDKKNKFIIISSDGSTDLQVKSLRAGCCDFLIKPLIKSDFIYAIQTIYNKNFRNIDFLNSSRIFTAVSFDFQTGKTFFLINLAMALREKTLIINLNPADDIFSYIKNSSLTETEQYKNIKRYKNSDLFIADNLDKQNLKELKKHFKYILIDYNEILKDTSGIMNETDRVFVLITPKNTISKDTNKYKNLLSLNKNINLIINKYDKKYSDFIESFQQSIGLEALIKIPNSVYAAEQSKIEGKTLIEYNSNLDVSVCYQKLAEIISNGK